MPYATNEDLPVHIRLHLPERAQFIFREAFNHAWAHYAGDPRQEEIAFRVAWSTLKKIGYHKGNGDWIGP